MKRILFSWPDGRITILTPAEEFRLPGESDDALCRRTAAKDVPAGRPWRIIDADSVPQERKYRNAWRDVGQAIVIDQAAAAAIDQAEASKGGAV